MYLWNYSFRECQVLDLHSGYSAKDLFLPLFSLAETHGELRQGVRREVGTPTAQAAPYGVARRVCGEHPLPGNTVTNTAESALRAAGARV